MTLTDLQTLASTDEGRERIRVMVAELMGWKNIRMSRSRPFWADSEGIDTYDALCGAPPGEAKSLIQELPLYTTSLDAMAEVEAGLSNSEGEFFRMHLDRIVGEGADNCHHAVHASALHRAMALILTKQPTKGDE